ncbi:MAG: DUF2889 domain-containing protein, partial [Acidimicrobiia bacterium]
AMAAVDATPSYPGVLPGPLPRSAPARRAGWLRRTSHLDTVRAADGIMRGAARVGGAARDLRTTGTGTGAEVLGEAALTITLEAGRIATVEQSPAEPSCRDLVGLHPGFGFRGSALPLLRATAGTPLGLLVDDLSGASAASGYLSIRERLLSGQPAVPALPPGTALPAGGATNVDVCAGWRAGGIPTIRRQTGGEMPVGVPPPAPSLASDDDLAWHAMPTLEVGITRRLRRLDLGPVGDHLAVDAMFRDSAVEPDGTERVVHEYALTAALDPRTLTILAIEAEPRSLPFPTDCPFAAASTPSLAGQTVHDLRRTVPKLLPAAESCTHLNDMLRSLADVAWLAGHLPAS